MHTLISLPANISVSYGCFIVNRSRPLDCRPLCVLASPNIELHSQNYYYGILICRCIVYSRKKKERRKEGNKEGGGGYTIEHNISLIDSVFTLLVFQQKLYLYATNLLQLFDICYNWLS